MFIFYHLWDGNGPCSWNPFLWKIRTYSTFNIIITDDLAWRSKQPEQLQSWYSWWRHQMDTFSALLAFCAGKSPHKGQWRGALLFSLIYVWINGWINNREAGDLRRHCAHYDVIVMIDMILHFKAQNYFFFSYTLSCPKIVVTRMD